MIKYWKHFKYVLQHKWYVLVECWRLGIVWQGIVHDLSKFRRDEWVAYANYYWASNVSELGKVYERGVNGKVDEIIKLHCERNPHHPEFWGTVNGDGEWFYYPMTDKYRREMLADWRGAGKAQGKPDTKAWYEANKDRIKLHPETRQWVEEQLGCV